MKILKHTLLFAMLLMNSITIAQQSIFEAIEANGESATYIEYDNMSKVDGKYTGGRKLKQYT